MKSPIRIAVGGIVLWLVPFLVSIPFFSSDGELLIRQQVFGTIMSIVLALSIAAVVIWFFEQKQEDYLRTGLLVGIVWLIMNWVLDLIVLVSLFGMPFADYVTQLAGVYVVVPITTIAIGYLLNYHQNT